MKRLEGWFLTPSRSVEGLVYDHPAHTDGSVITTSKVVLAEGRLIKTLSGSTYQLGEPNHDYEQFRVDSKRPIDPAAPLDGEL